jgi:hypothetical protein
MRRLVVTLDNTLDEWLAGFPNQAQIVRNALDLYHGDITTDTKEGLKVALMRVVQSQNELAQRYVNLEHRFTEQYELVEKLYHKIEELTHG